MNYKINLLIVLLSASYISVLGQENSPYSRYGLGDIMPNTTISNRGMGGIAAAFADYDKRFELKQSGYLRAQTVNFLNAASYSKLRITSFDLGFEVDSRTLHEPDSANKFHSVNPIISYVQLGIPLSRKNGLGMVLGLRPVTRISYKIQDLQRAYGSGGEMIDSLQTLFEGSGGSYQAYAGLGKSFKNFSFGFNTGYFFGKKDYSTRKTFIPDSIDSHYYSSNHETKISFGGLLLDFGAQYEAKLNKKTILHLGAYGNMKQKFKATKDYLVETFNYDINGGVLAIDTVKFDNSLKGKLQYPSTLGVGIFFDRIDQWQIGADFTTTAWSSYNFFGEKEEVRNSWMIKIGGQFMPDPYDPKNYWSHVIYRGGINFGPDYVNVDNKKLPQFGFSVGAGLPVRKNPYSNQYTAINLSLEYGKRGNTSNLLRENLFRLGLGFTLSDLWFIKKKYY